MKMSSYSVIVSLGWLLPVAHYCGLTQAQQNFSYDGISYNCSTNLICLSAAHSASTTYVGSLSLIQEVFNDTLYKVGVAYYYMPIRLRHEFLNQSASFNTSFAINQVPNPWANTGAAGPNEQDAGDGMAFVMSADNDTSGAPGKFLGFFQDDGTRPVKSVAVEFDNYFNPEEPPRDIAWNHVSLEFMNITYVAANNASDVNVEMWKNSTVYAWVEYSAETFKFEVRISNNNSRPISPLLTYTVDLFDYVEEYMWVGFSGATGGKSSLYYIRDWNFASYGVSLDPNTKARRKLLVLIIVGALVLVIIVVGSCFILFCVRRSYRDGSGSLVERLHLGKQSVKDGSKLQLADISHSGYRFSYKQLSVATGAFSDESKLGEGGFGSVYRGKLPTTGVPVAVKKISRDSGQGEKEFLAEVSIISQLRHRNLIQLLGFCKDRGKYLIVYELMPNGSLDKVLFGLDDNQRPLSWTQRLNIITGTAAALDYLHQGWKQQVIHRDIKASNIMLDDDWNAKLGDFGLARLVDHQRTPATTAVAGTFGYLAPEIVAVGRFTEKTDVYSFGAVVLEVACGRRAAKLSKDEVTVPKDEVVLVDWVWQRLSEGDLFSVVDKRLVEYDTDLMTMVLVMGLLCSHPDPSARPTIRHVVQVLAGDAPVPPIPASKPAPIFDRDSRILSIEDLLSSNPACRCMSSPCSRSSSYG